MSERDELGGIGWRVRLGGSQGNLVSVGGLNLDALGNEGGRRIREGKGRHDGEGRGEAAAVAEWQSARPEAVQLV